jgi:hypothetical protein
VATNIHEPNVLEQSKQWVQLRKQENKIHTHEELLAQGYVLDADGDYVKKWLPQLKLLPNHLIHKPWSATKIELAFYIFFVLLIKWIVTNYSILFRK